METRTGVSKSYRAKSVEEQQDAYDSWATQYEADLCAMGYRILGMIAATFIRHVPPETSPILDAGCGGGIQSEPLKMLGYEEIVGIDLSDGMLEVARSKNIYSELHQATLGETLDFPDNYFGAIISAGTITPKHAPPHSFDELIRVAKTGAPIVFSMRDDALQEPEYPAIISKLEIEEKWEFAFKSSSFHSMPYGEPEITHRIHVYKVR
ncbi:MAG: methyltransferase domain-containing protein [Gammaproteobacteria bacterium]|nr:methyltransferase domain-containing protein [Gammaproteobacteria bacterium]